jgi:ABC-type multidrug transport system ATPase subunit
MIQIQGLSKIFLNGKTVLKHLNLDVRPGESVAIWGSNGVGKTTFLRILATLVEPTAGEVTVYGFSVKTQPLKIRAMTGWVPAGDGGLFPRLTGYENMLFAAAACRLDKCELERQLKTWREISSFRDALSTPIYLCSSGMKQQLATCKALLNNPLVLLLDEPNRSIDPETRVLVKEVIRHNTRGKILVFTTHSREEANGLATREIFLREGAMNETIQDGFVPRVSQ